jgi:tetratricopeptide (TPR) repeat protein
MRLCLGIFVFACVGMTAPLAAQVRDPSLAGRSGGRSVFGDVTLAGNRLAGGKTVKVEVILYSETRNVVERNTVMAGGRYRFNNLPAGIYEIAGEVDGQELVRIRVDLRSPLLDTIKQDLEFESKGDGPRSASAGTTSTADFYERSAANQALFTKAAGAIDAKRYEEGEQLLKQILAADGKDFQAWTELANTHLLVSKYADAENEYLRAVDLRADYFPALLNLGRTEVAQKKYEIAIDVLNRAVKLRPTSADANYLLGESYLQIKKGSLAVGYLNEALRLDPKGMAEVHLRLARLYDAAGLKDKAVTEYEAFLKKRPDYADRKKLEQYIAANKKP